MTKLKRNELLAHRLVDILNRLYQGDRLDLHALADQFSVTLRTLQRDISRLDFLTWREHGPRYYALDPRKLGFLTQEDIQRFAHFASISDLFPSGDRAFFQEKLTESVRVKGIEYEKIPHKKHEFEQLKKAIAEHTFVQFFYTKLRAEQGKTYVIAPYSLVNKHGIWYLIGMDGDHKKTFSVAQITMLSLRSEQFEPNAQFQDEIRQNDSIYHGNQLSEIVVQVSQKAAPYFKRRNLLPNQELIHSLDDGGAIYRCQNVNEQEIIPLVQYWIPDLTIISPNGLQEKMLSNLKDYLAKFNSAGKYTTEK